MPSHNEFCKFGFRDGVEEVNGVRLHYWLGGDPEGTPVLLWHGFLGTSHSWYKVAPLLAQAGHSVLVPDMRGYGDSQKLEGVDGYDGQTLAEDFRQLTRKLKFGTGRAKIFLMAHDMGAPPALLWSADHPEEVAGLVYIDEPTLLLEVLTQIIVFTPATMTRGSLWWWPLALATDAPERLLVGKEREFLTWFYDNDTADRASISEAAIAETLRTFNGRTGVLGALGVYRAVFKTIEQTTLLRRHKTLVPILAIGGDQSLGASVADGLRMVSDRVRGEVVLSCGHFVPEERPEALVELFMNFIQTSSFEK